MLKSIYKSQIFVVLLGSLLAGWIKFIRASGKTVFEPENFLSINPDVLPAIAAMWHGQHFVTPLSMPKGVPAAVMISRSADGNVQAYAAEKLGLTTIRASGAQKRHQVGKRGGAAGFRQALRTLASGTTMALTCDIPKGPSRVCGTGIVLLAATSGRPVVPIAVATSRRITLKNTWDQAVINLPFSRVAVVYGTPVHVPKEAAQGDLEPFRLAIEEAMNAATARAYDLVDRPGHAA